MAQRVAVRFVADEDIAQDLVQEAILRAYLSLEALKDPERFRSWLIGILVNVCRSFIRDRETNFLSLEALAGGMSFAAAVFTDGVAHPEQVMEERELHRRVMAALEVLPTAVREAARLYYYEQLSIQEAAAILGVSAAAVKVRLHRARQMLAERLRPVWTETTFERERRKPMVEVRIADVVRREEKDQHVVILLDVEGKRALPIWIGAFEAQSIVLGVRNIPTARPITYTFMASLLAELGAVLEQVSVEKLVDDTFFGVARLRINDQVKEVDARPSDVLALAVRTGSPILVSEEVFALAGVDVSSEMAKGMPSGRGMADLIKFDVTMKPTTPASTEEKTEEAKKQARQEFKRAVDELMAFVFGGGLG